MVGDPAVATAIPAATQGGLSDHWIPPRRCADLSGRVSCSWPKLRRPGVHLRGNAYSIPNTKKFIFMKPSFFKAFLFISLIALSFHVPVSGCDFCAFPTPDILDVTSCRKGGIYLHVAEQFTHYRDLRSNGSKADNPTGQYMDSSISHVVLGGTLLDNRLSLQLNVPIIARQFKRPDGDGIQKGTVSGFGDLSLMAGWTVFRTNCESCAPADKSGKNVQAAVRTCDPDFAASLNLLAGIKFPTGDSSRLKEEGEEGHEHGHGEEPGEGHDDHEEPASGIHGHDLALGSGSWDGVFGFEFFSRYKRVFLQAEMQYVVRGEGSYSYRYANQLSWSGGPGVYLKRSPDCSIALQAVVAGETKGLDTFRGETAADSGLTSLYVGPRLLATFGSWTFDVTGDLPVVMNNTELQVTPSYRIRAGVTYNF